MDPNLPRIPHFYVDEKKRSIKVIIGIIFLSFLILSVPLGVFLANQKTNFLPQASKGNPNIPESSLTLSTENGPVNIDQLFKVNINLKSGLDEANLVSANINFSNDSLKMVRIERDSTFAKQWVSYSFDNISGTVYLIAGAPNPGVKTTGNISSFTLASLIFKAKKPSLANITINGQTSAILRNSDNKNILQKTNILTINVNDKNGNPSSIPDIPEKSTTFNVMTPVGGKVYSYYQPVKISWDPATINRVIAVSLYLNGENFGRITSNLDPKDNFYEWNPAQTILLPYITSKNTFQVGVTAITRDGRIIIGFNDGPFGISASTGFLSTATSSAVINNEKADLNSDNKVDIYDISILLSNFNTNNPKNPKADLNRDGKIGEIDLFLMRKLMVAQGLIKG